MYTYNCAIVHIGIWFFASEDFPHNNTERKYINLYQWKQTQNLKCNFFIHITEADMDIIGSGVNEYSKIKDHHMMANFMNKFGTRRGCLV
jgi:hypothetical protein